MGDAKRRAWNPSLSEERRREAPSTARGLCVSIKGGFHGRREAEGMEPEPIGGAEARSAEHRTGALRQHKRRRP